MREVPVLARDGSQRCVAMVDDEDYDELRQYTWRLHSRGYVCRAAATVLMHRQIMGATSPAINVDHWNGNGLDNRRGNLRVTTVAQNGQNRRGPNRNNIVGYRGVRRIGSRWYARGWDGRREVSLGGYDTPDGAARVAAEWRHDNMPYSQEAAQPRSNDGIARRVRPGDQP